jgi:ubiquinone/menaquinone biosynthesis C-methylase UbiE
MSTRIDLVPIEAEEFLSGIQRQLDAGKAGVLSPASAVQFFHPLCLDSPQKYALEHSEENFCEQDYLLCNPDVAIAIESGEFKSGFEHWIAVGKHEGRSFEPSEFNELEYLELNPDVAKLIADGQFASGLDHWRRCGRLERRSLRNPRLRSLSHLKRLGYEMQVRLAQIGDAPASPGTLRGAIGQRIILILRRLLWWYTRSVSVWANVSTRAFKEQAAVLDHIEAEEERNHSTLVSIQESLGRIAARTEEIANQHQQLASAIGHLESNIHSANELNETLAAQLHRLEFGVNDLEDKMNRSDAQQSEQIRDFKAALAAEFGARESLATRLEAVDEEIQGLRSWWSAQQPKAEPTTFELASQPSQVPTHLETSGRCSEAASPGAQGQRVESNQRSDALYLAFEDAFRGPREEIKRRQSVYLTFLKEAQAGTPQLPILDLGCGRGEWLELLRDHDLTAHGRDHNSAMVACCRALGLDAEQREALGYLRNLPDSSLGAITCFHMIEHIPFDSVVFLLREGIRVLKPGGLLILETPNPKNLAVASYSFYLDPTHLKPLPPEMLRFFVEAAGFSDCQVLELQSEQPPPAREGLTISKHLNELFYGPRDYGLIARRP